MGLQQISNSRLRQKQYIHSTSIIIESPTYIMAHHHHHPSSPYTAGAFAAALSASLAANNDNNNNNHTSPRPSLTAASPRTLPTDVLQWILDVTGRLPLAIARRSTHAQAAAKTIQAMQLRGLEYLKGAFCCVLVCFDVFLALDTETAVFSFVC